MWGLMFFTFSLPEYENIEWYLVTLEIVISNKVRVHF